MAYRGTVSGVQAVSGPPDRFHRLHVYDDGLVIGPSYASTANTAARLAIAALVVPGLLLWFGWVATNMAMMVAAAVGFVVLAIAALGLWLAPRRAAWPGPDPAAFEAATDLPQVRGADVIGQHRIVWIAVQPRIEVHGARLSEAREGLVLHLTDRAAIGLRGPDGMGALVRTMHGVVTSDPDPSTGTRVQVLRPPGGPVEHPASVDRDTHPGVPDAPVATGVPVATPQPGAPAGRGAPDAEQTRHAGREGSHEGGRSTTRPGGAERPDRSRSRTPARHIRRRDPDRTPPGDTTA